MFGGRRGHEKWWSTVIRGQGDNSKMLPGREGWAE